MWSISDFLGVRCPALSKEFVNSRFVLAVCGNFRAKGSNFAAELMICFSGVLLRVLLGDDFSRGSEIY